MSYGGREGGREGRREGGRAATYLIVGVVDERPNDGLSFVLGLLHLEHKTVELLLQLLCDPRLGRKEGGNEDVNIRNLLDEKLPEPSFPPSLPPSLPLV